MTLSSQEQFIWEASIAELETCHYPNLISVLRASYDMRVIRLAGYLIEGTMDDFPACGALRVQIGEEYMLSHDEYITTAIDVAAERLRNGQS